MDKLVIAATKSSPAIEFDDEVGRLYIKGSCYPENAAAFFAPVFAWLNEYLLTAQTKSTHCVVELTYFNSSSSRALSDMFELLDQAAASGASVRVDWRHHEENEMALEYGEEFLEDLNGVEFNLVKFSE